MSEPRCVCSLGDEIPVCGSEFLPNPNNPRGNYCWNIVDPDDPVTPECAHDRACHAQPLPAANTQETSNG